MRINGTGQLLTVASSFSEITSRVRLCLYVEHFWVIVYFADTLIVSQLKLTIYSVSCGVLDLLIEEL